MATSHYTAPPIPSPPMPVFSQLTHHIASLFLKEMILKPLNEEDERDEMDPLAEWYDYSESYPDMDESESGFF